MGLHKLKNHTQLYSVSEHRTLLLSSDIAVNPVDAIAG